MAKFGEMIVEFKAQKKEFSTAVQLVKDEMRSVKKETERTERDSEGLFARLGKKYQKEVAGVFTGLATPFASNAIGSIKSGVGDLRL